MRWDLARARFNEATVDYLVAVAVFGLPYRGCPFATVPDLRATPRHPVGCTFWDSSADADRRVCLRGRSTLVPARNFMASPAGPDADDLVTNGLVRRARRMRQFKGD